mgnify:CR=1 FL=1
MTGESAVRYIAKGTPTTDSITGDSVAATAYTAAPVALPAVVDFAPSRATRERFGQEAEFEAVLYIATAHLTAAGITIDTGDAFELPGQSQRYFVTGAAVPELQTDEGYLRQMVPVSRRVGRR